MVRKLRGTKDVRHQELFEEVIDEDVQPEGQLGVAEGAGDADERGEGDGAAREAAVVSYQPGRILKFRGEAGKAGCDVGNSEGVEREGDEGGGHFHSGWGYGLLVWYCGLCRGFVLKTRG